MDSIIARIVELDQQAVNIKEKIRVMEKNNSEKLKRYLDDLENQTIEEAKKIGREKYSNLVAEGEALKSKTVIEAEKACEVLENAFQKRFEELEQRIFNDILKR